MDRIEDGSGQKKTSQYHHTAGTLRIACTEGNKEDQRGDRNRDDFEQGMRGKEGGCGDRDLVFRETLP